MDRIFGWIWVGFGKSNELDKLQSHVDTALNMYPQEKRFVAHVTLARVKTVDSDKLWEDINQIDVPDLTFDVDKFYLL